MFPYDYGYFAADRLRELRDSAARQRMVRAARVERKRRGLGRLLATFRYPQIETRERHMRFLEEDWLDLDAGQTQ